MPRVSKSKHVPKPQTPVSTNTQQPMLMQQQQPTLFGSMKQGFGFGVGSSIAHNIFDYKSPAAPAAPPAKPDDDKKIQEFKNCMEKTYNDFTVCKQYLDNVTQL